MKFPVRITGNTLTLHYYGNQINFVMMKLYQYFINFALEHHTFVQDIIIEDIGYKI